MRRSDAWKNVSKIHSIKCRVWNRLEAGLLRSVITQASRRRSMQSSLKLMPNWRIRQIRLQWHKPFTEKPISLSLMPYWQRRSTLKTYNAFLTTKWTLVVSRTSCGQLNTRLTSTKFCSTIFHYNNSNKIRINLLIRKALNLTRVR